MLGFECVYKWGIGFALVLYRLDPMEIGEKDAQGEVEGGGIASASAPPTKYPASRMRGLRPFGRDNPNGNPGGRPVKAPKSLAAFVRNSSKDGKELVVIMLQIARGKLKVPVYDSAGVRVDKLPSHSDRMEAVRWLADRGFGRVVDVVDLAVGQASGPSLDIIQAAAALARDI